MMISHWLAAALIVGGTAAVAEPTRLDIDNAPAQAIDSTTITDEVALTRDKIDRMTVDVSVGGNGPYRFLVDTGAERTVISRQLAQRLKLESGKAATLHSVIGVNPVETVFIPRLQVSNSLISVVDAPALEAANIGADGMLGIDSLRSQRVMFDFKAQTMSITPANRPVEKMDGDTIVVRARARSGRLIFTHAKIDGQKVTVIIDTGSQVTIGNPALQRRLMRSNMWTSPVPTTIESVTGEKLPARLAMVKALELGDVHLDDLPIAFADAHIFRQLDLKDEPALLLGMNAMRAFDRVSIDFTSKKVRFVLPGTSMREPVRLAAVGAI
ncbi:retroviral-like aspartic protease family protein [Sphingomonas sp. RB56-2]|uniref:Retroviral-like aspartic protease family protein n=1 Tax=Sphingomonas brevis TaxID=2908206 RepID=A0ABT0S6J8_9SPHN|nr:retroviral-like aspartic protease family protein [Sphingomonas brevis]MCL6739963.1 retroviral-like aspartic protease family protein [Sphingomonas brevis]